MPTKIIDGQLWDVRSIIRLGKSFAITLPADWCWNNGIQAGDEVVLDLKGNKLVITLIAEALKE